MEAVGKEKELYPVLIETLWNVNKRVKRIRRIRKIVLIETLWNVNFEMLQYLLRLPVY